MHLRVSLFAYQFRIAVSSGMDGFGLIYTEWAMRTICHAIEFCRFAMIWIEYKSVRRKTARKLKWMHRWIFPAIAPGYCSCFTRKNRSACVLCAVHSGQIFPGYHIPPMLWSNRNNQQWLKWWLNCRLGMDSAKRERGGGKKSRAARNFLAVVQN